MKTPSALPVIDFTAQLTAAKLALKWQTMLSRKYPDLINSALKKSYLDSKNQIPEPRFWQVLLRTMPADWHS